MSGLSTLPFGLQVLFLREGNHAGGVMGGVALESSAVAQHIIVNSPAESSKSGRLCGNGSFRLKITFEIFLIFFLFAYDTVKNIA